MNERIKALKAQAMESSGVDGIGGSYTELNPEKFAELIVRECANLCDLLLDHKISSEWSRATHDCSRAIKKHFGVEK
jgi:hypothetical protein